MKHLGDITKINGANVPPVNVVIGGSPCQDLSVAGRREGLKGERSGLFMEQIRIIKEMRKKSEQSGSTDIKPRYMVWENVPGAFSSNKGQDFKAVLEEAVGVVEEVKPDIPIPEGGWHYSGAIMGNGFSVAWRVFDAQFWGVPQRRRRIALVADFGGTTAPEILFERESVSGDITQSGTPWKEFTRIVAQHFNSSNRAVEQQHAVAYSFDSLSSTGFCNGLITLDRASFNQGVNAQYDPKISEDGINSTLTAKGPGAVCESVVRRLTPLECERLQGFPDGWTDIGEYIDTNGKKRKTSDSARYKALGNSIALPPWAWVLERISKHCGDNKTMASLFDGIGGFPLIWETLNGEGTCVWASEIEEFPIAVTKYHFKGENNGK